MKTASFFSLFFVILGIFFSSANAHDLWLAHEEDHLILYYGHHSAAHQGVARMPYLLSQIETIHCLDATAHVRPPLATQVYPLRLYAPCAFTQVHKNSGYWSKTPYGTQNLPKNQVNYVLESWEAKENVTRIDAWHEAFKHGIGSGLELLPTHNPFSLKINDKIRLIVLYHGKALKNVRVFYQGHERGHTDENGMIAIRLRHSGLQLFQVTQQHPLNTPQADSTIETAALVFELGENL
jgi:nickel transport protein